MLPSPSVMPYRVPCTKQRNVHIISCHSETQAYALSKFNHAPIKLHLQNFVILLSGHEDLRLETALLRDQPVPGSK